MADNSIQEVNPQNLSVRTVVPGGLSCVSSLSIASNGDHDTLYVADFFALRSVDGDSGEISDISRAHAADATSGYTSSVAAGDDYFYTYSNGELQKFDRESNRVVGSFNALGGIQSYLVLPDGDLLVLHARGSTLTRLQTDDFSRQSVLAENLSGISGLTADASSVYFSQGGSGRIMKLSLSSGVLEVFAEDLDNPGAVALTPANTLAVIEAGQQRLTEINATNGSRNVIATSIPLGRLGEDSRIQAAGLAAGRSGTLYLLSDRNNAIYRIRR